MTKPRILLCISALLALACGGDEIVLPEEGEPAAIAAVHGAAQTGIAGAVLGDSLVARVTDTQDRPVVGVWVRFDVVTQNGGDVVPDSAQTDSDGKAWARWQLGGATGTQRVEARVRSGSRTLAAQFSATVGAGEAVALSIVKGNNQTGTAGSALGDSLVVRATDENGNGVAGVTITWAAVGGGTVSEATTATDASGHAGVVRILGPAPGAQSTTATSEPALEGSPVTFSHMAQVGAAGRLAMVTQPPTTAQSGVAFSPAPQVRLLDANGNPVATAGVAVSVVLSGPTGGALVGSTTQATNAQGIATFTGLGISGPAGSYTLNFSGANLTGVSSNAVTIGSGSATRLVIATQPPSSAQSGVRLSPAPVVQLVDAAGNPVRQSGVTVQAQLNAAGASVTMTGTLQEQTNGEGRATFDDLTLTGQSGNYTILFASGGLTAVTSAPIGLGLQPTTTTITSVSPASTVVGQPYTVSVRVTGTSGTPAGQVGVADGAGATCTATLSGGNGSCQLTSTSTGTKTLTATYSGQANVYGGSSDTEPHAVNKANTTVTVSDAPASTAPGVNFTVTVTVAAAAPGAGTPTGTVTVAAAGGACAQPITLSNGTGSCQMALTTPGSGQTITATYAGDASFNGNEGTTTHDVTAVGTTTEITSIAPATVGVPYAVTVRLTAADGSTPPGQVDVTSSTGGQCSVTTFSGGVGSCSITSPVAGPTTITATYAATFGYQGSSDSEQHTVAAASTSTSLTSSDADNLTAPGESVTFTATVSPASATGSVTFRDGDTELGTVALSAGVAQFSTSELSEGAHQITAVYSGDASHASSTGGPITHTVQTPAASTTTVSITSDAPDPSPPGATITVQYTVTSPTGPPTGTVTVTDAASQPVCSGSVADGECRGVPTVSGDLTASYEGSAGFAPSRDTEPHTIAAAPTTTTITADGPDPSTVGAAYLVEFEVTASSGDPPTGRVEVDDGGGGSCADELDEGQGSCTLTSQSAGQKVLTARYLGTATHAPSSDTESHLVLESGTTTTISDISPEPSVVGQPYTVRVSVTSGAGTPTGSVTVSDGAASCGFTLSSGEGACELASATAGTVTVTATYAPSGGFTASSTTAVHQVSRAETRTTIVSDEPDPSTPGQSVTVRFTVVVQGAGAGTPTGAVAIADAGGATICTAQVAAGACAGVPTANGALRASYAGDANFEPSDDEEPHRIDERDDDDDDDDDGGDDAAGSVVRG